MYTAILIVFLQFSTGILVVFTVQCLDPKLKALPPCANAYLASSYSFSHTAQNELLSEFLQNDIRYCCKKGLEVSSVE
jgi:hypothetical protein